MIKAAILARALNGEDVVGLFDDADHSAITVRARAVKAGIGIGDVVTDAAFTNLQLGIANGVGQGHRVFWVGAEHMKGQALRCLLADPGQAFELIDEPTDRFGKVRHRRCPQGFRKLTRRLLSREAVRIIRGFSDRRFLEGRSHGLSSGWPVPHRRAGTLRYPRRESSLVTTRYPWRQKLPVR